MKNIALYIISFLQILFLQTLYYRGFRFFLALMNYGVGISGMEIFLLKYAKKTIVNAPLIFDVDANTGQTVSNILSVFGDECLVHCFEPNKNSFNGLSLSYGTFKNIILNNIWLSSSVGNGVIHDSNEGGNTRSSMYDQNVKDFFVGTQSDSITLDTIDNYCKLFNITHIDFLKIDTEGHELSCLLGALEMINSGSIHFIQFEFNHCSIASRVFFRDFWDLLSDKYLFYRPLSGFWNSLYLIKDYDYFFGKSLG